MDAPIGEPVETGGIYRDWSEGARARRDHLLSKRRVEAALLPLEMRRIYVRRVSRAFTGAFAAFAGGLLWLGAGSPPVQAWLAARTPGPDPAPLSTLLLATTVAGAIIYFVVRCLAEERFARAMRRAVAAGDDVFVDVDRLAWVGPTRVARHLASSVEVPSVALPLAGAALLAPALAIAARLWLRGGHSPAPELLDAALVRAVPWLWLPCAALCAAAVAIGVGLRGVASARLAQAATIARPGLAAAAGAGLSALAAVSVDRGIATGLIGLAVAVWLSSGLAHLAALRVRLERRWLDAAADA